MSGLNLVTGIGFSQPKHRDAGLYPFCLGQPSLSEYLNCCLGICIVAPRGLNYACIVLRIHSETV